MRDLIIFVVMLAAIVVGNQYSVLSVDLSAFLIFILVLGLLAFRDRKKIKFQGFVFIRRTTKGRDFIDRTANNHISIWKTLGVIGVVVAIPTLVFGSIFLVNQAFTILNGEKEGGVRLLLPGPVSEPTSLPATFVVPWWIWVIGVAAVIIPHEFMHGIMCRVDKVKIKSVGWILLAIIPGAFVEPDEKQLKKAKRSTKMKVYAAGSFANLMTALVVFIVIMLYFTVSFSSAGVYTQSIKDGPAYNAGLKGTITEIDGTPVKSPDELKLVLLNYKPGDVVYVKAMSGENIVTSFDLSKGITPEAGVVVEGYPVMYAVTLGQHPERGTAYLGVNAPLKSYSVNGGQSSLFIYQSVSVLLVWIFVFSLGIGIVNMLPIKPFDGGLLFEEIVGKFAKNTNAKTIVKAVSGIMLLVLIFNLIGPIFV